MSDTLLRHAPENLADLRYALCECFLCKCQERCTPFFDFWAQARDEAGQRETTLLVCNPCNVSAGFDPWPLVLAKLASETM